MKLFIYAVLDAKAATYGNPFYGVRDESAMREFSDAVNDGSNPHNQWHNHPEDFSLYKIGEYDTFTAEIVPQKISCICTASALKREIPIGVNLNGREKEAVIN